MDRETLAEMLAEGRSIESIARETGRAASTVAYWVNKYELSSAHTRRHASRGGIERAELEALLAEGSRCAPWPSDWTCRTPRCATGWRGSNSRRLVGVVLQRQLQLERRAPTTEANCPEHGLTTFIRRGTDGFRCRLRRTQAVHRRRREVKRILVAEAGGSCVLCGYDRSPSGLHFHHLDPQAKSFALSRQGVTRSLAAARAEAAKCVLLCSNCHAEVEAGTAQLPASLLL